MEAHKNDIFLSLGSNMGDRLQNLSTAASLVENELSSGIQSSSVYETAPWGKTGQAYFLNSVLRIQSDVTSAVELLEKIREIECRMGRIRLEKWGPRIIDIDILFFNKEIIDTPALTIPHAGIPDRNFVLVPMVELDRNFIHPVSGVNMEVLLAACADKLEVRQLGKVSK